jgi:putative ABC transport system substrate-binding protein
MNDRRGFLIVLGAAYAMRPLGTFAQNQPARSARIGILNAESASSASARIDALRAGLRELGYVEGRNVVLEYRFADSKYERLPELAADLVRSHVDVIVTSGTPATRAAKQATSTIPIVMASSGDAVATGLVASLARPGGNVTGSAFLSPELSAKRLELLKEALPRVREVGYLANPVNPVAAANAKVMEKTAASLKLAVRGFEVRSLEEMLRSFKSMSDSHIDALVVAQDSLLVANFKAVADLAVKHRLPAIGPREFGEAGGLFGYGHAARELWHRAALYIDKVLKGAKPADLPIQQPTKFELLINMKAAKALAISVPDSIVQRADRVIE